MFCKNASKYTLCKYFSIFLRTLTLGEFMKKIKLFSLCLLILLSTFLVACSTNSTQAVAKDLDTSIKNLVIAVSSLDWPEDEMLENLNNIQTDKSTSNIVATDTQIDTSEIYTWLENAHSKINVLLSIRGDLLLYLNEIYSGNVAFESADLLSINVYLNIIKDNSTYLSSYSGMLKNQINQATALLEEQENVNLINAYLIKAVETLQVRCAKIDTSVLAMSSIIDIIKCNLINDYYNNNPHKIEEIKEQETNEENETPEENDNAKQENGDQQIAPSDEDENDVNQSDDNPQSSNSDEQNAINFDGETQQVDNLSDDEKCENSSSENKEQKKEIQNISQNKKDAINDSNIQQNINYDDQIMTLEEPIVGDITNKAQINDETAKMQKNEKIDAKNAISQQEYENFDEIDKEFTLTDDNIVENNQLTREIIKENAILTQNN